VIETMERETGSTRALRAREAGRQVDRCVISKVGRHGRRFAALPIWHAAGMGGYETTPASLSARSHAWNRFLTAPPARVECRFADGHAGECVLVTGAGGSIGSALVLAIASAGPARIVLLEWSEQALFEVLGRLEAASPRIRREAILGDCGDAALLDDVLRDFQPRILYHAAAFKHVPLLEENPFAAVRNNAIGTYALAQAAARHGTPNLVLISTDKAVNPCSMLGVTKRISELAVASLSSPQTRMNAVRLVNVIGSSGSVVPIFLRQIAAGGPVTVTHPQAERRFISLDEAIEAILATGASHCEGKILLPRTGEPVNIADLARFLIDACAAGKQVPIRLMGLRPGEKLAEDLVGPTEIREGKMDGCLEIIRTPAPSPAKLAAMMERLVECEAHRDLAGLVEALQRAVPEYRAEKSRAGR
jgi:FlaA1/EpsC-like NDP-sugar epimerase